MKENSPRAVIEDAKSNDNLFVSRNFEALILAATIILISLGFSICFALLHVAITAPEKISVIFYGAILLVIFLPIHWCDCVPLYPEFNLVDKASYVKKNVFCNV